ncbi:MAG: acylphosphatase [Methyloprofundus sp.]|nr:acylphosphatase [Methyloprofundus sp.]
MICKKYFVSGRVQGVSYRQAIKKQAKASRVQGYAVNLPDGRVEVLLCGSSSQLEQMSKCLWKGSKFSTVIEVQCIEVECLVPEGFKTA